MSHQLSHTFPICDAEAQTPVKPPSTQPHPPPQCPKPTLPNSLLLHFLVDKWLEEKGRTDVSVNIFCGNCKKDGLHEMCKTWPHYIFSQSTDWYEFIKCWPIASFCWPTVLIKGKLPSQGAKCYGSSLLCQQTTFSSPATLFSQVPFTLQPK